MAAACQEGVTGWALLVAAEAAAGVAGRPDPVPRVAAAAAEVGAAAGGVAVPTRGWPLARGTGEPRLPPAQQIKHKYSKWALRR